MQSIPVTRRSDELIDAAHLRDLAESAGYEVVETVGQRRAVDSTDYVRCGKAEELADKVEETGADAVLLDDRGRPQQAYHLEELCPPERRVLDRCRLVTEMFAGRATDRTARLQVGLAELRYERKRVRAARKLEEDAANERRTRDEFEANEQGRKSHRRSDRLPRIDASRRDQRAGGFGARVATASTGRRPPRRARRTDAPDLSDGDERRLAGLRRALRGGGRVRERSGEHRPSEHPAAVERLSADANGLGGT